MLNRTRSVLFAALSLLAMALPQAVQAQAFSNYVENKLVDHMFRGVSWTAPTAVYIGLSTAACSDSSVGTEVANSANYARVALAPSTTNWAATNGPTTTTNPSSGTGGQTSNNSVVNFPTPSGSWGTVTHWFLVDSGTYGAGNLILCAALTAQKTIGNGDAVSFAVSSLTVTVQ
jgi:hypothetical protein